MVNARKVCLGLAVVLALVSGVALAQPEVEWERTFGGERGDYSYSLIQTSDGGFAMAGYTESFGAGIYDIWLVQTDANGDSLWSRTFGGGSYDNCYSLIQTADGGFAIPGNTRSFGAGLYDFWLVRTDANGDSLLSRTFGGGEDDLCVSVIQTADGGFAMAGYTWSLGAGFNDFWLVRTNADGDSLWSRTFGGGNTDYCYSLIETADGGFAMTGATYSFGEGNYHSWLVRTDRDGDSLWSRTFVGGNEDLCYSLIETADGGFAMAGWTYTFGDGNNRDFWLVRTNAGGDSLWSCTFGGENNDRCYSLVQTADGGFAMVGYTESFGTGGADFWLVRTDAEGDSLWSQTFGGEENESRATLIRTVDGGYAMGGFAYVGNSTDFYLVKTTPDPASVREPQVVSPFALHLAQPYPNPFNSTVTIPFFAGLETGATRLSIFDPLGRRVAELIPDSYPPFNSPPASKGGKHSVVWDASGMPAGQYIVRLEAGNQQLSQRLSLVK